jgi:hypothetical protein
MLLACATAAFRPLPVLLRWVFSCLLRLELLVKAATQYWHW